MAENDNIILLKVDFAFQYVMRNKRILASLIATILGIEEEEITEVTLLQRDLMKVHADDKLGILDVHVVIQKKLHINIELQMWWFKNWVERSEFYLYKMYVDQVKTGSRYENINPCISISILNFELFPGNQSFYSKYQLLNTENHQLFTDKIEFHVLELPKLKYASEEVKKTKLYRWARMFTAESWEEYEEIGKEDPIMGEVIAELKEMSQDEVARYEYLHRQIALMDQAQEEDERRRFAKLRREVEEGQRAIEEGQKAIEEGQKAIEEGQKAIEEGQKELERSQKELERSQKKMEENRKELEENRKELEAESKRLEEGYKALEQKQYDTVKLLRELGVSMEDIQEKLGFSVDF